MSINMGAYRADKMTSRKKLAVTPMTPPLLRRIGRDSWARTRPSIFGIKRTIMLNQNSVIISSTSKRGHVGNSWKS